MLAITMGAAYLWNYTERQAQPEPVWETPPLRVRLAPWLFMLAAFLPMYLISAFMSYVGNDYANYVQYYYNIAAGVDQEVDIAYKLINEVVIDLGLNFQWIYVLVDLIAYGLLVITIRKFSRNYAVSYLLFFLCSFFFMLGLNQIRQFVAVMLIMYAFTYIEHDNFPMYAVFVGIAALFHFIALVMLPFYFVLNRKLKLSVYVTFCLVMLPLNFFFPQVLKFLYGTFLPRYLKSNYVMATYDLNIPYLLCAGILLIFVLFYYEKMMENKRDYIFANAILVGVVLAVFCSWLPEYKRFVYSFWLPAIYLVPNILRTEKNRVRKYGMYAAIIGINALYIQQRVVSWGVLPYKNVFNL